MYKEDITNEAAKIILGKEYIDSLTYSIISDRDKFVVTGVSSKGVQCFEQELETSRDEEVVWEEDEVEHEEYKKPNKTVSLGTAIAAVMIVLMIVAVCAAIFIVGEVNKWTPL